MCARVLFFISLFETKASCLVLVKPRDRWGPDAISYLFSTLCKSERPMSHKEFFVLMFLLRDSTGSWFHIPLPGGVALLLLRVWICHETNIMGGCGKNGAVRQYIRSNNTRVTWTSELHRSFVDAFERLGGQKATPKLILREMGVRGLTIGQVKSHIQMYRSREMSRQYTSQCNGGRRHSYEDNTDGHEYEYNDSFNWPKDLVGIPALVLPSFPSQKPRNL